MSTHALTRLKKEYKRLLAEPIPLIEAHPKEDNYLEWHYIIEGPVGSPYQGGFYHGKVTFPKDYPFKPPSIMMITPSGRFKPNTRLCLSMSDFHVSFDSFDRAPRTFVLGTRETLFPDRLTSRNAIMPACLFMSQILMLCALVNRFGALLLCCLNMLLNKPRILSVAYFCLQPETWNPMWSCGSILTGLLSFMLENSTTYGSIESSDEAKRALAARSCDFNAKNPVFRNVFPHFESERQAKAAEKVREQNEKVAADEVASSASSVSPVLCPTTGAVATASVSSSSPSILSSTAPCVNHSAPSLVAPLASEDATSSNEGTPSADAKYKAGSSSSASALSSTSSEQHSALERITDVVKPEIRQDKGRDGAPVAPATVHIDRFIVIAIIAVLGVGMAFVLSSSSSSSPSSPSVGFDQASSL